MSDTSTELSVDSRAIANFFIGQQHDGDAPNFDQLTRPLLERLVLFADDVYQSLYGVPLVDDSRAANDFEPFLRQLRQALTLYGIDRVDQPLTRAPVALSFMLRERDFAVPFEANLTDRQRDFLETLWHNACEQNISQNALFWVNRGEDWPTEPQDMGPGVGSLPSAFASQAGLVTAAE